MGQKKTINALNTTEKIVVDGVLDEVIWKNTPIATDFVMINPGNGTPIPDRQKTEVKIGKKTVKVAGGRHVSSDGESIEHSGIHIVKNVDENEFLKIYTKNIKAIFDLKPTAQRVLQYLMTELQKTPNADAIYLAWVGADIYFSEHDIQVSRASFHRALSELIQKGFLAESTRPNMFWFNPNLFFNGNRLSFIYEYRKIENENIIKPHAELN